MAGRISCCLNLPFQDSNSAQSSRSPPSKTTTQITWTRRDGNKTEPRKSGCSLALSVVAATVLVGAFQIIDVAYVEAAVVESPAPRRWSEKRMCPAWLRNSLETIVPENLPRPSSHRRLELAGLGKRDAPPVGGVVKRVNNKATCFSL